MRRGSKVLRVPENRFTLGGFSVTVAATPWCDCPSPAMGFTKTDPGPEGIWVRPCCGRRTESMFLKYGNEPVPTGNQTRSK